MDTQKFTHRHQETVQRLLTIYDGKEPLHLYLKKYFAAHKKHGSKDRKLITAMIYSYFRMGANGRSLVASQKLSIFEFLRLSCFITGVLPLPGAESQQKADFTSTSPLQRFIQQQSQYPDLKISLLFPFRAPLSKGLDIKQIRENMLYQPDVFVRIRPGKEHHRTVLDTLEKHGVSYKLYGAHTLQVPAGTPVQQLLAVDHQVVIQDSSSQQTGRFMQMALDGLLGTTTPRGSLKVWDACAASGGKSILLCDLAQRMGCPIQLTVSDIRHTILKNLRKRFKTAGINTFRTLQLDLTSQNPLPFNGNFDLVLCDAPCSGSGTWARNPENIQFFDEDALKTYYQKQTQIARKAWSAVTAGGYFLYMTCSVFEKENEAVSQYIAENSQMELVAQEVVTSAGQNSISMFAALYTRKK